MLASHIHGNSMKYFYRNILNDTILFLKLPIVIKLLSDIWQARSLWPD